MQDHERGAGMGDDPTKTQVRAEGERADLPQDGTPQSDAPQDAVTQSDVPQDGTPQQSDAPQAAAHSVPFVPSSEHRTFAARMADAGYSAGRRYDAVKNAFLSYRSAEKKLRQLRSRITSSGETFAAGKKLLARLCLVGGYLRLFLALDPKAYNVQKYHHKDYTEVVRYAKTPFMIKLSSDRQVRYALELIEELMLANGFVKDESYIPRDQAGVFRSPRRRKTKIVYVNRPAEGAAAETAAALPPVLPAAVPASEEDDEADDAQDIGEPEAIDVRLPRRAAVVDKKGRRVGKIRKCVWRGEEDEVHGEFRKEDTNVFLYAGEARTAYVDKNDNILTLDNAYLATIRRFGWLPVLLIVIILAVATVLSVVLSSYFMSRSTDYAPVLFVAHEDGTQWQDEENLPVFMNETFGDTVIAPGMQGTYRFALRNDNADTLVFALIFSEENTHGIGLVYKLKRDGVYVSGITEHVGTEELSIYDMTIEPDSTTVFEIEWYWQDNDEVDTIAGENGAAYTLNIAFTAYVRE